MGHGAACPLHGWQLLSLVKIGPLGLLPGGSSPKADHDIARDRAHQIQSTENLRRGGSHPPGGSFRLDQRIMPSRGCGREKSSPLKSTGRVAGSNDSNHAITVARSSPVVLLCKIGDMMNVARPVAFATIRRLVREAGTWSIRRIRKNF
jgi:hypothetical protein